MDSAQSSHQKSSEHLILEVSCLNKRDVKSISICNHNIMAWTRFLFNSPYHPSSDSLSLSFPHSLTLFVSLFFCKWRVSCYLRLSAFGFSCFKETYEDSHGKVEVSCVCVCTKHLLVIHLVKWSTCKQTVMRKHQGEAHWLILHY